MILDPKDMYWDSCVFIRYLTRTPVGCLHDIDRYIEDAKKGLRRIHFSTIAFTEIRGRFLKDTKYGDIRTFFEDFRAAFHPIDPNPNILIKAGELRDAHSTNPGDPKSQNSREIGTPDSIHLMTCLYAREALGVADIVFHTFDNGKGKNWEGRCVPLLSFERWFPDPRAPLVQRVCALQRCEPVHPEPDMFAAAAL